MKNDWYLINAGNIAVGRLASYISIVLRGKNKANFNPHIDNGDFVVVTNINKIKFSGKKFKVHFVYWISRRNKETRPIILKEKNKSQEILKLAVKRMLPGDLGKKTINKLKIYDGDKHPHELQKPKIIDFANLNKKNIVV